MLNKHLNNNNCTFCSKSHFSELEGFIVCTNCGTENGKTFTNSSYEIASFTRKNPTQYLDIGKQITKVGNLGSEIGYYKNSDFFGKQMNEKSNLKFKRLNKKYHTPAKSIANQTHLRTFLIFNSIASKLQISVSIKERVAYLYWKQVNLSTKKITNHVLLISLLLLYTIKEKKYHSSIKFQEVVETFNKSGHRVTNKNILQLAAELNIKLNDNPIRKSEDYVTRISQTLICAEKIKKGIAKYKGLTPNKYAILLETLSNLMLSYLSRKYRGGTRPFGYAASIVYLADRAIARYFKKTPVLTQKLMAKLSGAKEYTIRDHCYKSLTREFNKKRKLLLNATKNYLNK